MTMRSVVCFLLLLLCSMAQAQKEGTVSDCKTLKSEILKGERRYAIYLPPGYDSSDRSCPLLYLLHPAGPKGTLPNQQGWINYGMLKTFMDRGIASGEVAPMIVVTPDANFGTRRVSYFNDHPEMFSVSCPLSAAIRGYEKSYLTQRYPEMKEAELMEWYKQYNVYELFRQMPEDQRNSVSWYIACGDDDALSVNNVLLHADLKKMNVPHEFRILDGKHDWVFWRSVLPDMLHFVSAAFLK